MGTVFKKTATKPLPAGAKIVAIDGERFAEWTNRKGKNRRNMVTTGRNGEDRIVVEAGTYTAKYRDGSGIIREVATGCRDESAARARLVDLEKRAEKVKAGILTAEEDAAIDHQATPLSDHIAAYLTKLESGGVSLTHRENVHRALHRLSSDCRFIRLADCKREQLERWFVSQKKSGMGARTRNTYRSAAVAFCNWCVETGRMSANPFAAVAKADEAADQRRQRRALSEAELMRLLDVARRRPLLEAMTIRHGPRKGQQVAKVREETRIRLEKLGRERALIYKTLVLTGLRKGELAAITVGQVVLDADLSYLILNAADEKNRQGSTIPLRPDLADDLRAWLAEKTVALQDAARRVPTVQFDQTHQKRGKRKRSEAARRQSHLCQEMTSVPTLPSDTPLFTVPRDLVRILDRDLRLAGIPKEDDRGRKIDVHALRHTFGTLLSKSGVAPRTAQAAMRHSSIDLTMNTYTDPRLLDIAGAMEALPSLPLTVILLENPRLCRGTGSI